MSEKPRVSIASDYAVLKAGEFDFYFGYEYGKTEEDAEGEQEEIWGFRAKHRGVVVLEYPVDDGRFEVTERLLEGIGKYLAGEGTKVQR